MMRKIITFNKKSILLFSMLFLIVQIFFVKQINSQNKLNKNNQIETVEFCNLINDPNQYKNKMIRTIAIFAYGGEDFTVLYSPQCYKAGIIEPYFADTFESKTKSKFVNKISRQKHSSGTVRVTLVGILNSSQLQISYLEKANYISKEYHFPDRLSSKTNEKLNCCKLDSSSKN